MTELPTGWHRLRAYFCGAIAAAFVLIFSSNASLPGKDIMAVGLAIVFTFYACWLALRLRRENSVHVALFWVASLSLAAFFISVAVGPQFGTPGRENWFFPLMSLVAGLVAVVSNVALYLKASRVSQS